MSTTIYQLELVNDSFLCFTRRNTKIYLSEIIFLEANINYTHLHLRNGGKITVSKTLKIFERILENHHFYRVHRSFMINADHLLSYDSSLGELMLTNNHRALTSRRRKIFFENQIQSPFLDSLHI